MIRSFGDTDTEALFRDKIVRPLRAIARPAKRELEAVHAASRLDDLLVPSSNWLEKLKGDLKGFYSIRVNDQYKSGSAGAPFWRPGSSSATPPARMCATSGGATTSATARFRGLVHEPS